ncbi:mycofactocin oligosaccharide methyltransferase MftM [Gordonia sp. CPCC 205333]|uniref:mycofactocin oligosaccharide methyltransferase MftM n=1 Tax=Gordonia sp. CPCC 205333 TaxID=3140790 RepID=UPI003AF3C560
MTGYPQISAQYRASSVPSRGAFQWRRAGDDLVITHDLDVTTISDASMIAGLLTLIDDGVLAGQHEFEAAAVAIVESVPHADPWACFYRNTLDELADQTSPFAPVHRRARAEIVGTSVLEVGSCFGFFALGCARDGLDVTACDLSQGAVSMLSAASRALDISVRAGIGDARALPFDDNAVDTVTLIHLLEHLDETGIISALTEALRVARRRVVVAVPFEAEPSPHFGHLHSLGEADLLNWVTSVTHAGARIDVDHGGWLILTPLPSRATINQISPRLLAV